MKSFSQIARVLKQAAKTRDLTQAALREQAGVSQRTVTKVLSGREDFKISTLLALADRLGLELLLVPKDAALAVGGGATVTEPVVQTRIQAALDRLQTAAKKD